MNQEQKQEKLQVNIFGVNFIQSIFPLFLSAFVAVMALVAVNFYSIKTMSALRAGTYGETEYVKARIDETHTILEYINTGQDKYLQALRASYAIHKSFNRGSGVGLYNVKKTVEKMGRSIRVSSDLGSGSKFTVLLPVIEN